MDSLTQIVLGASVGEAVLGKKIGNRAMLWGAIAGTIPDLDVFIRNFTDNITATEMHRGFSHSIVFAVLMAFILGWAVFKNEKVTLSVLTISVLGLVVYFADSILSKSIFSILIIVILAIIYSVKVNNKSSDNHGKNINNDQVLDSSLDEIHTKEKNIKPKATIKNWRWLFFWALVTHPLLDSHTTWGTQLFWPFEYRLAYKNIFVADPLYTIPFLILVIIAMCYNRSNPKRQTFNKWGLIISSAYMALSLCFKGYAHYNFKSSLEDQKIAYTELESKTTPLNIILWNGQVETENGYKFSYYSLFDSKPISFSNEIAKNHELLDPYRDHKKVQQLLRIADNRYILEKTDTGLVFYDIRFGQFGFENDAKFMFPYELSELPNGELNVVQKRKRPNGETMGKAFEALWERIKGN